MADSGINIPMDRDKDTKSTNTIELQNGEEPKKKRRKNRRKNKQKEAALALAGGNHSTDIPFLDSKTAIKQNILPATTPQNAAVVAETSSATSPKTRPTRSNRKMNHEVRTPSTSKSQAEKEIDDILAEIILDEEKRNRKKKSAMQRNSEGCVGPQNVEEAEPTTSQHCENPTIPAESKSNFARTYSPETSKKSPSAIPFVQSVKIGQEEATVAAIEEHKAGASSCATTPTSTSRKRRSRQKKKTTFALPEPKQEKTIDEILTQIKSEEEKRSRKKKSLCPSDIDVRDQQSGLDAVLLSPPEIQFQSKALQLIQKDKITDVQDLFTSTVDLIEAVVATQGEEDRVIVGIHSIMADIWAERGDYQLALELFSIILEKEKTIYGPNSREAIKTRKCITSILINQKEFEKAIHFQNEVSGLLAVTLGSDHEQAIDADHELAQLLHKIEKIPEAIMVYKGVCEKVKKIYGVYHEKTLAIQYNLACALLHDDKLDQAFDLFHNVFEKRFKTLGMTHPLTVDCMSRKAHILSDKEKYPKAIKMFEEIIQICTTTLGEQHPETVKEKTKLISTFLRARKLREGLQLTATIAPYKNYSGEFIGRNDDKVFHLRGRFIEHINVSRPVLKKVSTD